MYERRSYLRPSSRLSRVHNGGNYFIYDSNQSLVNLLVFAEYDTYFQQLHDVPTPPVFVPASHDDDDFDDWSDDDEELPVCHNTVL